MSKAENNNEITTRTPILATKIHIPHDIARTIKRQRLIDRINTDTTGKLTFISAPAGFGKSTLLEHWARQARKSPAWYSLDQGDNDPVRFWQYVIAAIHKIFPRFKLKGDSISKMIRPSYYKMAITMLLNEINHMEPFVLVLDDFHFISDVGLIASFVYFIECLPEQVHLIITSRTDLPFSIAKLSEKMTRLSTEDLRFSPEEGSEFYLTCMDLELSEKETGEWMQKTEGWITGMKLAALSLQGSAHSESLLRNFSGAVHLLDQYLLEEVFLQQSEPIRRFLINCSVLKRMSTPLCQAVAGDLLNRGELEYLVNSQLFIISLDDQGRWYRFHHLFAEFLSNRLRRLEPERIPYLLEQAGQWCEREGLQEEALDYYLTGRHYGHAVRLLEEMTEKMVHVNTKWLCDQFGLIPESILLEHPILYFSYVYNLIYAGNEFIKVEKMMRFSEKVYKEKMQGWTEDAINDFWASYYFVAMFYELYVEGNLEKSLQYMMLSKQHKPTGTKLVFANSRKSGLPSILKEHMPMQKGDISKERIILFLNQLIGILDGAGLASVALGCLAECYYEFNELDEAEKWARRALETRDNISIEALLPAQLVLSRILWIKGNRNKAKLTMESTRQRTIELGMAGALIYCDAELALMALEEGNSEPMETWMKLYRFKGDKEITDDHLYEYHYLGQMYSAQGRIEKAHALTGKLIDIASKAGRFHLWVEISVLHAALLYRMGRTSEALTCLLPILRATEPLGYIRTFLDRGEIVAELLTLLIGSWDKVNEEGYPSLGYVRDLLASFGRSVTVGTPALDLKFILTKKEYEVFCLIVKRKTNKEIAAELGIGHGTVRSHLNNIYSKLMVDGRAEAIKQGQAFGL
ncbi:hypothetical protein EHV15_33305 [Paenibacillus oralis]|uniref:HTH luxR-type domain-containing protein n=1 Tax=Paenibacillus oralis TaxID=2490856 RepID=A0A3P3UFP3_9BACL|nr:LuxR C-terminal-related transcriptional regulator [Paenibacillus oralis]RRJ67263.1 hypothetical protein EHV15_33305 [Paenibacillus oralis]